MKKLSLFTLLVLLSGCEIRSVVSANFVKEFCSCLFVVKRSEAKCFEQAKQFVTPSYEISRIEKSITAKFLGSESTALYTSKDYGCQLR